MSYEAWQFQEQLAGRNPDREIHEPCGDCWWTMVNRPPTKPFQRCWHGHLLPWFDPETMDPERGYRCGDDDGTEER